MLKTLAIHSGHKASMIREKCKKIQNKELYFSIRLEKGPYSHYITSCSQLRLLFSKGVIMNDNFQPTTGQAVKALYDTNPHAKKLFDWTATLKNDASETSLERLISVLDISRKSAVALAHDLEVAGCGEFIVGRKGAKSRFQWHYSRVSLGKVAVGETEEIEPVSSNFTTEAEEEAELFDAKPLTIASAKALLAQSLGVQPDQIEITVRG